MEQLEPGVKDGAYGAGRSSSFKELIAQSITVHQQEHCTANTSQSVLFHAGRSCFFLGPRSGPSCSPLERTVSINQALPFLPSGTSPPRLQPRGSFGYKHPEVKCCLMLMQQLYPILPKTELGCSQTCCPAPFYSHIGQDSCSPQIPLISWHSAGLQPTLQTQEQSLRLSSQTA